MKYDHKVKFNGIYYAAGQEVPDQEPPVYNNQKENLPFPGSEIQFETGKHKYTYQELDEIPVRKIKLLAEDMGFEITKTIKDDVIKEFMSKQ